MSIENKVNLIWEIIERWRIQGDILIENGNEEDFWIAELEQYAREKQIEVLEELIKNEMPKDNYVAYASILKRIAELKQVKK